jgi:hypothetical protein
MPQITRRRETRSSSLGEDKQKKRIVREGPPKDSVPLEHSLKAASIPALFQVFLKHSLACMDLMMSNSADKSTSNFGKRGTAGSSKSCFCKFLHVKSCALSMRVEEGHAASTSATLFRKRSLSEERKRPTTACAHVVTLLIWGCVTNHGPPSVANFTNKPSEQTWRAVAPAVKSEQVSPTSGCSIPSRGTFGQSHELG